MMTRKQMEAVLKSGGSVSIRGGAPITRLEDLPKEEDLATTDEEKSVVADGLRGQIDDLAGRLAKLEGGPTEAQQANARIVELEGICDGLHTDVDSANADRDKAIAARDKAVADLATAKKEISDLKAAAKKAEATSPAGPAPSGQGQPTLTDTPPA